LGHADISWFLASQTADLTEAEQLNVINLALAQWAAHADITFTQAAVPGGNNQIDFHFGATSVESNGFNGYGYFPPPNYSDPIAGDIFIDDALTWTAGTTTPYAFNFDTGLGRFVGYDLYPLVLHEIGHALGMLHPLGNTTNSGVAVMDPFFGTDSSGVVGFFAWDTLQADDIAGIQSLYGAPETGMPDLPGDFNGSGDVDDVDIDLLASAAMNDADNPLYDLNDDGTVTFDVGQPNLPNPSDSDVLIYEILETRYGDLNLDGEVFLSDLSTFATHYRQEGEFGWAEGNINGSQEGGTAADPRVFLSDLSVLATNWRFGVATGAVEVLDAAVPEPSGWLLAFCGVLVLLPRNRKAERFSGLVGRQLLPLERTIPWQ
jgi:hypothetical protein